MRKCSPPQKVNLQLKARPTSLATGTFPFGGVHVASSQTSASSSAPSFLTSYMSFLVLKKATTSYHQSGYGGVELVNHTKDYTLAMVDNERQDDWDAELPHVEFAYNNSTSAATRLAPNEVHMARLPRLPLTILDRYGVARPQSLARDHLAYCELPSERQHRANDILLKYFKDVSRELLFARCMPLQFSVWNGETQAFRTFCARSPSLWVIGFGCVARSPLFAKAQKPARVQRCSRPHSR